MIRGILLTVLCAEPALALILFPHKFDHGSRANGAHDDGSHDTGSHGAAAVRRKKSDFFHKLANAFTPQRGRKKQQEQEQEPQQQGQDQEEDLKSLSSSVSEMDLFSAWNILVTSDSIYADRKIVILLDGLNRINEVHHEHMLYALKDWVRVRPRDVKICITSRGEEVFEEVFQSSPGFILHEVNYPDMLWFVRSKLYLTRWDLARGTDSDDPYTKVLTPEEQTRLEHMLVDGAEGNFSKLWVMKTDLENEFRDSNNPRRLLENWEWLLEWRYARYG